jgi:hypothetical protein
MRGSVKPTGRDGNPVDAWGDVTRGTKPPVTILPRPLLHPDSGKPICFQNEGESMPAMPSNTCACRQTQPSTHALPSALIARNNTMECNVEHAMLTSTSRLRDPVRLLSRVVCALMVRDLHEAAPRGHRKANATADTVIASKPRGLHSKTPTHRGGPNKDGLKTS